MDSSEINLGFAQSPPIKEGTTIRIRMRCRNERITIQKYIHLYTYYTTTYYGKSKMYKV